MTPSEGDPLQPAPLEARIRAQGFSLIELMIVVAIIAILSGLAVVSFNNITRGSGARGASDLAASVALLARIEAMSSGFGSLLVIDNGTDPASKLQRLAVLRAAKDTNGTTTYELVAKPTYLPKGVFFLPEYSRGMTATNLTYAPGSTSAPAYSLKFNASGHLESGVETRLVFAGNIMDGSGDLQNPDAMIQGRRGFILRSNGRPAFFQTPEQMSANP